MVADKRFRATCKGCGVRFDLFHYIGLDEGSRMGSHSCVKEEDRNRLYARPSWSSFVRNVKEATLIPGRRK